MAGRPDRDDTPSGFCAQCGEPCTAIWEDCGIGAYEYWGSRGTDVNWQPVSPCCEAEVVKDRPELPEEAAP